jgi:Ca2+-binding RTX toxin-like protein
MHHTRTIRRLALGAVLAGVAATGLPSLAQAASTCTYDGGSKVMTVHDDGVGGPLWLTRVGQFLAIEENGQTICSGGTAGFATVTNTNKINVIGKSSAQGIFGGYIVDQSQGVLGPGATPESDGNSEIEISIRQTLANPALLMVVGNQQSQTVRVGGNAAATVMLGADADNDITLVRDDLGNAANAVIVTGGDGADTLTGRGGVGVSSLPPSRAPVTLRGGAGVDTVVGGNGADELDGGSGDDQLFSAGGGIHGLLGGAGFDRATTDAADNVREVEQRRNVG